jgi:hypothetical protein
MNHLLVVFKAFLSFSRGDIISDPAVINQILNTEYSKFVTKTAAPYMSKG